MKKLHFTKAFLGLLIVVVVLGACNHNLGADDTIKEESSAKSDVVARVLSGNTEILENNTSYSNDVVMAVLDNFIKDANVLSDGHIIMTFDSSSERDISARANLQNSDDHQCVFEFVFYHKRKHKHSTGFWPWQWEWCVVETYKDACTICGKTLVVEFHSYNE